MNRPRLMTTDYPVKFDSNVFDFGNLKWGKTVSKDFTFRNVSDKDVIIENVHAECGCTDAAVVSNRISPGQKGFLHVTFSPNGFDGSVTKKITLHARGYFSETNASITAKVAPSLRLSTRLIDWGKIDSSMTKSARVEIKNNEANPVKIISIHHPSYISLMNTNNSIPANGAIQFGLELSHPPLGDLNEAVEIDTNCPNQTSITVMIHADVFSKWNMSERQFFFDFINKTDVVKKSIVIHGLSSENIKLITTDCKGATVDFVPSSGVSKDIVVTLTVQGSKMPTGEMSGSVLVETNDPIQSVLRIPIVGGVQDSSHVNCCRN